MEIVQDKALKLRLRKPAKVTNLIPKSHQLNDNEVLVNWGLDEAQMLNNIGIKVPSPIRSQYKWPSVYKPFDHQVATAEFLTLNRRAFCFNEQGTGKSASCIWAADFLMNKKKVNRVLVICPLSIMHSAWKDDLFKFAMHRRVDVAYGSAHARKRVIESDAEFVIINYDGIPIVHDEIKAGGFDLIIVDEANHLKNPNTRRWKFVRNLIEAETRVWMLTGTPAAQSPVDAYGLAKLINPQGVSRTLSAFRDLVMYKVTQFKWVAKPTAPDIVHEALQPAIRFTKEECMDLPDMVYTSRYVELNKAQKKYYEQLRKDMFAEAVGEQITAVNAASQINKLLQLSTGALYTDEKEILEFDISNRYKALKEIIDETNNKVLVFAPYKHCIDLILKKLRKDKITANMIRGDVSANKRTSLIRRFQDEDDPRVLVIQPQAAAHGVTLTAADTIVWWGPTASLETYAQANARVHRSGQTNKCTVVQLAGSAVEQRVYKLLDDKIDIHSQIIDLYKNMLD